MIALQTPNKLRIPFKKSVIEMLCNYIQEVSFLYSFSTELIDMFMANVTDSLGKFRLNTQILDSHIGR